MTRIVMGTRWQALRRAQEIRWLEKRNAERAFLKRRMAVQDWTILRPWNSTVWPDVMNSDPQ